MGSFGSVRTVLLDLDGTLYEGSRPVDGAPEAVAALRGRGLTVRFTTNTDSVTPAQLAERLRGMGFEADEGELVTPVAVAARLFGPGSGARVLPVAARSVRELLGDAVVGPDGDPTHVLVADPSYGAGYDELDAAFRALRAGAELVATQVGRLARRDDGEHLDTGGFVRLLEYAAKVEARLLGKPSRDFFATPLDALGEDPATALIAGDDAASDIAGARAIGAMAVLVRTGKAGGPDVDDPGLAPDATIDSVTGLPELLGGEAG
jgi:HAD superfamily hydrolase (TIGR01458 family)